MITCRDSFLACLGVIDAAMTAIGLVVLRRLRIGRAAAQYERFVNGYCYSPKKLPSWSCRVGLNARDSPVRYLAPTSN